MSSRESDSAFPPPRRGGNRPQPGGRDVPAGRKQGDAPDAYPSGTPPYGTPGITGDPFRPTGRPADTGGEDDVPKTETTLTTRVRINIPGSRPIPPVVVRSAVKNEDEAAERTGGHPLPGAQAAPVPDLPAATRQEERPAAGRSDAPSESESTGAWFRPRQKGRPESAPAGAPAAGGSEAPAAEPQRAQAPRPTGTPASPFAPQGGADTAEAPFRPAARQEPAGAAGNDPYAASSPFRDGSAAPAAPASPFHDGAPAADPFGTAPAADPFAAAPVADPFGTAPAAAPFGAGPAAAGPGQRPAGPGQRPGRPAGPGAQPNGAARPAPRPPVGEEPEDTQIGGFEPIRDDAPGGIPGAPSAPLFSSAPAADPFNSAPPVDPFATGRPAGPGRAGAPVADPFGASPATAGAPRAGRVGAAAPGATTPGGGRFADIPYEPAEPFPGSPRAVNPQAPAQGAAAEPAAEPATEPASPEPARTPSAPAKSKGKGGKLVVYAVGGLLFAGAAAYGTGLMLNQADIPKGTTVLGTDIGGDTRDQAVSALDGSVAKTGQQPVKLKIGETPVDLDPASAGLTFDTTATVDALTKHSYNPVEVIGSLAGGGKAVAPEVRVDRAKLKSALEELAAKSGQGLQEGFVRFTEAGQTEVVPGRAGQAVDASAAVDQVEQAYRARAAGQQEAVVALPLSAAQPKVGEDALKAAAEGLGKQVLAGNVTVTAGAKKFEFGKVTAAKVLVLAPDASGKVGLKWDYDKLTAQMAAAGFDKLKVKKNGQLVPLTAQDVAEGIGGVLDKTGAARAVKFTV
ncbi:peptidoglycan binding domain-containing protein [Kitasatospora camelliae]|uniref:Peptidoglycan binding domain-containing protein n=1 Tax=Kitasatospora camelliae TaxID=3156397 RepID=A0AAU8JXY1_9ACTN